MVLSNKPLLQIKRLLSTPQFLFTIVCLMYLRNKPGLCLRKPNKLNSKGQRSTRYNILQCQQNCNNIKSKHNAVTCKIRLCRYHKFYISGSILDSVASVPSMVRVEAVETETFHSFPPRPCVVRGSCGTRLGWDPQ